MAGEIKISNHSAKAFIGSVSNQLGIEHTEDNREFSLHFTQQWGHGYVKTYDFDHGLTIYEFDCTLSTDLLLRFENTTVRPLIILFNREEPIDILHSDRGTKEIRHLESVMSSNGTDNYQKISLHADQPTCFLTLVLDRKAFEDKIDSFLSDMHVDLENIFRDVNGINPFYSQGYYSLDIAKFIEEFTTTDLTDFMRYVFLEGKAYEILTHFLKQYLDDVQGS